MPFDKAQALDILNRIVIDGKPVTPDPQRLSDALDDLFARANGKTVAGVDYHVYGGVDDATSDLDETVVALWLISGSMDGETGLFHEDDQHPSIRVPIVG